MTDFIASFLVGVPFMAGMTIAVNSNGVMEGVGVYCAFNGVLLLVRWGHRHG